MRGFVHQLNLSNGGVPKQPVERAWLSVQGLEGDRQAHPNIHGGPDRALSLFGLEVIQRLQEEGHPITAGSTGENVTTRGLPWERLQVGDRLAIGDEVVVQVTGFAPPCKQIRDFFLDQQFKRISHKVHPGESRILARVLREGWLAAGQPVKVLGSAP